jgi:LacI family transcriptional regulator
MSARRPTIQDIARKAKVGVGTVSRVLNDRPGVSEVTRNKVLQAIEELDYRPSFAARLMRTGKSKIIGFITDEIASTPFAVNIIKGAQSSAWEQGRLLLVVNSDHNSEMEESAIAAMLERGAEGIIYAAMFHREVKLPERIREVPVVLLDCFDADRSFPSVVPDEVEGGRLAAELLSQKGHKRIAFINLAPPAIPAYLGRLEGFRQGLALSGLFDPDLIREGPNKPQNGYVSGLDLMKLPDPPTAIFCASDRIAMGVYGALHELGHRIPQDIAVLGFDNQEVIAEGLRPALSTIALPHYEMGQWAVQYLIEHHNDGQPTQKKMSCPFIERESI